MDSIKTAFVDVMPKPISVLFLQVKDDSWNQFVGLSGDPMDRAEVRVVIDTSECNSKQIGEQVRT